MLKQGRTYQGFFAGGPRPPLTFENGAWIEAEEWSYPAGGFTRRAYAPIRANAHAPSFPAELIGQARMLRAGIPDTFFTIPARLRYQGRTWRGFLSTVSGDTGLTFTPEAE